MPRLLFPSRFACAALSVFALAAGAAQAAPAKSECTTPALHMEYTEDPYRYEYHPIGAAQGYFVLTHIDGENVAGSYEDSANRIAPVFKTACKTGPELSFVTEEQDGKIVKFEGRFLSSPPFTKALKAKTPVIEGTTRIYDGGGKLIVETASQFIVKEKLGGE